MGILRSISEYRLAFFSAFGPENAISISHVRSALAEFQRTLVSSQSSFDRYYFGDEKAALSAAAVRGLELFKGRALCVKCHTIAKSEATFTDEEFHSIGVNFAQVQSSLADLAPRVVGTSAVALDSILGFDTQIAALGRFVVTKDPNDIGKFRTPSLRNVALTAPYMHDGSVITLEAAIDAEVYYRSLEANRPLILTSRERADLVAFLESLTSPNATAPLD